MRIESISIKNFRSLKECKVNLDAYTSLVGPNGSGKSTVIEALNVFFRHTEGSTADVNFLEIEDFHKRDARHPVEITVTFHELSKEAQEDFSHYVRHGRLIITAKAILNKGQKVAEVKQYGQRLGIEEFKPFFEAGNKESVTDLRDKYKKIKSSIPNLPNATTKSGMQNALSEHEASHPDDCVLIPSEELFYGFSKGRNRLAAYIQWIYVPAVKDVTKENVEAKNTALGKILARTVRTKFQFEPDIEKIKEIALEQYRNLLKQNQDKLNYISKSLGEGLARWAHPGANARLAWTEDTEKSVRIDGPIARMLASEGGFEGEITRFGHGLHRSYFLALVEMLASEEMLASGNDTSAPTLILGCEEPEIYQHPPQARHLADVLEELSENNAQILISTHSPYFVSGWRFERLRMVRRDYKAQQSNVSSASFDEISERISKITGKGLDSPTPQQARLHQVLQPHLSEMFFANKIVFVEGLEDVAYITTSLIMLDRWNCFRRHGAHIVAVSGKSSLIRPLVIAEALGIPAFAIFDADATNEEDANKEEKDKGNRKKNKELLTLLGGDPKAPFPTETAWGDRFVQWPYNLGVTLEYDVGEEIWKQAGNQANDFLGHPNGGFDKHPIHIGHRIKILHGIKKMPQSLNTLCQKIIKFLETN